MRGLFVVGTDTGVGKTEVACALLELLAAAGLRPRALKPVETGCAPDHPEDALALRAASGPPHDTLPLDEVCPHRFVLPAAPLVAAEAEGRAVDPARIDAIVRAALGAGAPFIVEAAGGLMVPLWREADRPRTNLDLAVRLGLPALLVAHAGLGTINHCVLTAQALQRRGVPVLSIVLNRTAPADDPTLATNAAMIAELTGLPVGQPGPFESDAGLRRKALSRWLAPLVDELRGSRA